MSAAPRAIVDAHHHLWDLSVCRYPWLLERGVRRFFGDPTPIQRNYLVEELKSDASGYELLGSVHVQVGVAAGDEHKESAWLQQTGDAQGFPSAIVAYCDLSAADAVRQLEAHKQYSRVRGIRQILGRSIAEDAVTGSGGLIDDPRWRDNLGAVADLGLSFDLQLIPPQALRVAQVLADVPNLPVAICHAGSPSEHTPAGQRQWAEGMRALADLPNVHCKISGFGMFNHAWTVASVRPYIEHCIDLFSASRSMFGSNFPVDKLYRSYQGLWAAYEQIAGELAASEQRLIFADTAARFYRLALPIANSGG